MGQGQHHGCWATEGSLHHFPPPTVLAQKLIGLLAVEVPTQPTHLAHVLLLHQDLEGLDTAVGWAGRRTGLPGPQDPSEAAHACSRGPEHPSRGGSWHHATPGSVPWLLPGDLHSCSMEGTEPTKSPGSWPQSPGGQLRHPVPCCVLTMRWAPGPHMTTSSSSSCLATSRTLWPKGVIWSPLLV